jgi:hypothetical protein
VLAQARQTKSNAPALLWVEAAGRARVHEFDRADRLMIDYNARVGFPPSFVLKSRALKPLRQEHLRSIDTSQR